MKRKTHIEQNEKRNSNFTEKAKKVSNQQLFQQTFNIFIMPKTILPINVAKELFRCNIGVKMMLICHFRQKPAPNRQSKFA